MNRPRRVSRRDVLGGGAAVMVSLLAQRLQAQTVFGEYDQAGLDAAYNQDVWAPNAQLVRDRWAANSALVRARIGEPTHVAYGPTGVETLDIYRASQPNAPIHIFIHGGAWRMGLAKDSAFAAELFVRSGVNFVVPDFAWVQNVGGSLLTMADQVRRAIAWVHRNASSFGGDAGRISLSGHSSGGHFAAVALTTDWTKLGLPPAPLKAVLCCSGLFDLKAPRLSSRREYVKFDDETEESLSPLRHLDRVNCPVAVLYASRDSPEFQRQSRDFADALRQRHLPSQLVVGDAYNHFELIETLANPYGIAGRVALKQITL